jgi:glucan phosphorylase
MNGRSSGQAMGTPGMQLSIEQLELQMAVSSNETGIMKSMPNFADAITPVEKFTKYSLDYDNLNARGKAEAYERGLGYTKENAEELIKQISEYVTSGKSPYDVKQSEYGMKFKFRVPVTGPNGKTKNVIAVYQIDAGKALPRLITNYLEDK